MSLINYVEPISIGSIFAGIGAMIMFIVVSIIFYKLYIKLVQWINLIINREAKYEILEECFLDGIAKKKGIDLDKELVKRKMFETKRKKSFRRKVEEQIYEDMFGKEDKKK